VEGYEGDVEEQYAYEERNMFIYLDSRGRSAAFAWRSKVSSLKDQMVLSVVMKGGNFEASFLYDADLWSDKGEERAVITHEGFIQNLLTKEDPILHQSS
jgi:hypothetical protein